MVLRDVVLRTRQGFIQKLPHAAPFILRTTSLRTIPLNTRQELDLRLERRLAGLLAGQGGGGAPQRSPSGGHGGEADGEAERKARKRMKPSASDHRHATVVIRLLGGSQDGGEGVGAMPGDAELIVPEFLLRPRTRGRGDPQEGRVSRSLAAGAWASVFGRASPRPTPPPPQR